ncbi:MAG: hypothetical protein ABJZ56_20150 [Paracoccaceae bacterium]
MEPEQLNTDEGFIAKLDQSGGSTPKAMPELRLRTKRLTISAKGHFAVALLVFSVLALTVLVISLV